MRLFYLLFFVANTALQIHAQQSTEIDEPKICLAINCGEVGTTICFKDQDELLGWQFTNEIDKLNEFVKRRHLTPTEILIEYPGMEQYCRRLTILDLPKDKFNMLSEEIKQRMSGI